MRLSGLRSRMGVRFGLLLALWRWVWSSRTCWEFRWLSFGSSATSGRASRLTSSSGSLLSGHGLIHGGPSCWGFMRRLSMLPDDSLHLHILRDNIADAKGPLPCANWARGIEVKFAALGMASPFCLLRDRRSRQSWLHGQTGWSPATDMGWPACVP